MNIRCIITATVLSLMCSYSGAQIISRALTSVTGGSSEAGGYYLSWSVGEAVDSTIFGNMRFLTQGFQQPSLINLDNSDPDDPFDAVDVFPNPVSDLLTVSFRIRELNNYYVNVYDVTGRLLISKKYKNLTSSDKYLDFSYFNKGLYLVHVFSSSIRKMDRVFKIEKL
jgi:hypothetical protein